MNPVRARSVASLFCAALAALTGGCTPRQPAPAAVQAAHAGCRPVRGLEPLLRRGNVLLFGELHGTRESPAFIGDVLCAAVGARLPLVLALEVPRSEQRAIDGFLASAGTPEDRAVLAAGAFWGREYPDGRSSEAMLALIEQARSLRRSSAELRVVTFAAAASLPFRQHDRAMSDSLARAAGEAVDRVTVVLTGNVHARLARGMPYDSTFAPMGHLLARRLAGRSVVSLGMAHEGGEAWTCRAARDDPDRFACNAGPVEPQPGAAAWSVELATEAGPGAPYGGRYGVGPITASLPVRAPGPASR